MNGERYLLVVLLVLCLFPISMCVTALADRQAEASPVFVEPPLPARADTEYILALDAVLSHLGGMQVISLPQPGVVWQVVPLNPSGYCYSADAWQICIIQDTAAESQLYSAHAHQTETAFEWIGQINSLGEMISPASLN